MIISQSACAISKYFFFGLYKFLAYLECMRSYAWYFGHSDPDLSSVFSQLHFIILIYAYVLELIGS